MIVYSNMKRQFDFPIMQMQQARKAASLMVHLDPSQIRQIETPEIDEPQVETSQFTASKRLSVYSPEGRVSPHYVKNNKSFDHTRA